MELLSDAAPFLSTLSGVTASPRVWLCIFVAACAHRSGGADRRETSDRGQLDAVSPVDASSPIHAASSFDASSPLNAPSQRAVTDPESLEQNPDCRGMLYQRPPPSIGEMSPACRAIFIEVAAQGGPRAQDAVNLLRAYCKQVFEFMVPDCRAHRSPDCEINLGQITAAGAACDDLRARGAELVQEAQAIDARLGAYLNEANRLIELRRVRCEMQNRGSRCKDYKWQRKEWSSPPSPNDLRRPPSPPEPLSECRVPPLPACPSTRAVDRETQRLASAFEANLPLIDDRPRNRFVCRAWQNASMFCDRASVAPRGGSDAGASPDLPDATK